MITFAHDTTPIISECTYRNQLLNILSSFLFRNLQFFEDTNLRKFAVDSYVYGNFADMKNEGKSRVTIVADGGSTKTDWRILGADGKVVKAVGQGINPVYQSEEQVRLNVVAAVGDYCGRAAMVCFYGAGILPGISKVGKVLAELCPGALVETGSDLKAAAIALFGDSEGLAGILGTGSNSGLYDGKDIVESIPAGGFILGDEGSGAYFGKRLISDWLKKEMPQELAGLFQEKYSLSYPVVVEKVYRSQMPSRFLAGLTEFVAENRQHGYMQELLRDGFGAFVRRNILKYGRNGLPFGVIGSVGAYFYDELKSVAAGCGINLVKAERSAGDGLERYYSSLILR